MHYHKIIVPSRQLGLSLAAVIGCVIPLSSQFCLADGVPHGPIYKTLDTLAGGIEKVINIAIKTRKNGSSCDQISCDDGCDVGTLDELNETYEGYETYEAPLPMMTEMAPEPSLAPQVVQPRPIPQAAPKSMPKMAPQMPQPMPPAQVIQPMPFKPVPSQTIPSRPMPMQEAPTPPRQPASDDWLDNFSPEPAPGTLLRSPPAKSPQQPAIRGLRSPSETIDSLPNPFLDDPQSKSKPVRKSANQPASYWEPW